MLYYNITKLYFSQYYLISKFMLMCQNLSYQIGQKKLFDSFNFTLETKKHLLILGPSGSGKSTLLAILAGLQKPNSGNILYEKTNLYNLEGVKIDQFRGANLGIIFQNFHLIKSLTLYQNIALAQSFLDKKIDHNQINYYLKHLGLIDKAKEKADRLSVGEAQRLALIRALINKPKWILCDEPTSALDNRNTENMLKLLEEEAMNCGASLIIVTHDQRVKSHFKKQQILEIGDK